MKIAARRYALHTTARAGEASKDCFFNWGFPVKGEFCMHHTVLRDLSYETVVWLSRYLVSENQQVVVTDDADWDERINDSNIAVYYSPTACIH